MELLQLRYFIHVAETQNMTRSANDLHVAQSAISQSISRLEEQLGVHLFDRKGKNIFLNEYGRTFLNYARRSLETLTDGQLALKDLQAYAKGHVRLGVFAGSILLPELLKGFREKYPDISFELIQHGNPSAYDLSIVYTPDDIIPANAEILFTEEIFLAVPTKHRLAGRKEIVLQEVAGEDFISLTKNKALRNVTDRVCEKEGFRPNIIYESDDPASVRGLISAGMGIAFVPSISWYKLTGESFVNVRIAQPVFQRTLVIQWDSKRYMTAAMKVFREYVVAFFHELYKTVVLS